VVNLTQDDLEKTPDFGMNAATEYLLGMANVRGKVIALLDIDRVVDKGSIEKISELATA
jgi:purine-binding chemotaxis protein CheW